MNNLTPNFVNIGSLTNEICVTSLYLYSTVENFMFKVKAKSLLVNKQSLSLTLKKKQVRKKSHIFPLSYNNSFCSAFYVESEE